jgi:hypothetical protein
MLFVFVSMDGFVITCLVLLSTPLRAQLSRASLSLSFSLLSLLLWTLLVAAGAVEFFCSSPARIGSRCWCGDGLNRILLFVFFGFDLVAVRSSKVALHPAYAFVKCVESPLPLNGVEAPMDTSRMFACFHWSFA